jgi:hypothetical protein
MMRDEEIRTFLERRNPSELSCEGGSVALWRDFDAEELRMRREHSTPAVRVDEKRLIRLIQGQGGELTEERIIWILCDIYRRPKQYPGVVL